MSMLRQLRLLLWKNFLLQIRRPIGTIVELILPIAACLIMIVVRQLIKPDSRCFRTCQDVDLRYRASRINVDNSTAPVIGYFPDTPLARHIMETASCLSTGNGVQYATTSQIPSFAGQPFRLRAYNNTDLLEQEAAADVAVTDLLGAIVFDGLDDPNLARLPLGVEYAIRLRPSSSGGEGRAGQPSWRTDRQQPRFEVNGVFHYVTYDATFAPLQYMINQAITRVQAENGAVCSNQNETQCPGTADLVTICTLSANGTAVNIEFDAMSPPQALLGTSGSLACTCNRTSVMQGSMELFQVNCSCNHPITMQNCFTRGPVDISCCGRCSSEPATGPPKKTFLPTVAKNFPYPAYVDDTFLAIAGFMLGLLLVLALIYPAGTLVREIVLEKKSRLRETMKMMGMKSSLNFLSWFIKQFLFWLIACVAITIIIKAGDVFPKSDGFLLFLFFLVYFISAILFLFMLSSFFSDPRVGMICAFGLWFVTFIPYLSTSARYDEFDTASKAALCFFCVNSALGMGLLQYSRREIATEGVLFSNAGKGLSVDDDFTLAHVFGMFVLNSVLYVLVLWYMENVFPGEFGIPKPFYFFLEKSYWCGSADDLDPDANGGVQDDGGVSADHEDEPAGVNVGISIRNLRKVYHTGGKSKVAVENLSLNMHSGQITALLGHNGAGKTTTMSMLVGLFPPSGGDAFIDGHNVRTDIDAVRQSLGLCPQHNVLYDVLTVQEHLSFFLELKTGRRGAEADAEIKEMIKDLQLVDKTNWKAASLSGGMKRKLSVAIALIGGSKVVILDEPSSGMDPYARRATWDLLLKHKEGRTILLTTHFMDEADLLGDRIAIMANGTLMCSGSSLFLKTRFGVGYHLVVVKDPNQTDEGKARLMRAVKAIKGSRPVGDVGAEMSFVLPQEGAPQFRDFFSDLEINRRTYGISNFGISITTLEEVFHRVGESVDVSIEAKIERQGSIIKRQYSQLSNDHTDEADDGKRQSSIDQSGASRGAGGNTVQAMEGLDMKSDLLQGIPLWLQQFRGMFIKRLLTSIRHPLAAALQLLFPVILTICALLILKLVGTNPTDPILEMSMANLQRSSGYVADFRDGGAALIRSPLNLTSPGRQYLINPALVTPADITRESLQIGLDQNGSRECCGPSFVLSDYCIRQRYQVTYDAGTGSLQAFDRCGSTFGFKNCLGCLNARVDIGDMRTNLAKEGSSDLRFSGSCEDSTQCPAVPTTASARRRATLYQARVLEGSNTGDYFKTFQSGYTLHSREDDLPDSFRGPLQPMLNCYHAVKVSCLKPDPADKMPGDPEDCFAFQPNKTCLRAAYDPDNYGWYSRIWYSAKSIHTLPYAINTWSNMHLRNTMENTSYTISTSNNPLPRTVNDQAASISNAGSSLSFAIIATLGMSFLTASFAFNPVEEKLSKSKHVQFVSGVQISVYWMANFAWDLINYFIPLVVLLVVYAAFDIDAFKGSSYGAVFVLLIMFGWSGIPFAYLWSFLFSNPLVAYGAIAFFQFILGLVYLLVIFILGIVSGVTPEAINLCRWVFYTLPHFSLAQGLSDLYSNFETKQICDKLPTVASIGMGAGGRGAFSRELCYRVQNVKTDPFDWQERGIGKEVLYMAIAGLVFFIMVIAVEKFLHTSFTKENSRPPNLQSTDGEDEDVARERLRIESMMDPSTMDPSDRKDLVVMRNLTKSYFGSKLGRPSADSLCLGVPAGECFGLLGVNGAGKTTTFNMLTGDVLPSYGTAFLNGHDVRTDLRKVQQCIGYCPQFDALCEKLNAYELLTMYARLRGIPERRISGLVDEAVKKLNLSKWADRQCGTYSGGNKRKLGAAIALVGDPPIVFLDEPTSGMDPGARRFLWDVLTSVMRDGRSIVLTSHSMEECEALCTRLAIMVNGQFKCLGSIQDLKSKFGSGYTIMLKVAAPAGMVAAPGYIVEPDTAQVEQFISQKFPGACLLESHHGQLQYEVGSEQLNLSFIFGELQDHKEALNIVDFSVSQTSLEQVFLNFARTQFTGGNVERRRRNSVKSPSASGGHYPEYQQQPRTMSTSSGHASQRPISPANIVVSQAQQPQPGAVDYV